MFHLVWAALKERLLSCAWTRRQESIQNPTAPYRAALHCTAQQTFIPQLLISLGYLKMGRAFDGVSFSLHPSKHGKPTIPPPALLRLMWLKEKRCWKTVEIKPRNIYILPNSLKNFSTWIRADTMGMNQENILGGSVLHGDSNKNTEKINYPEVINWIACSF